MPYRICPGSLGELYQGHKFAKPCRGWAGFQRDSFPCFGKVQSRAASGMYLYFLFLACVFVMASLTDLHFGLCVLYIFLALRSCTFHCSFFTINLSCPKSKTINVMLHCKCYLDYLSWFLNYDILVLSGCPEIFIFLFHLFISPVVPKNFIFFISGFLSLYKFSVTLDRDQWTLVLLWKQFSTFLLCWIKR